MMVAEARVVLLALLTLWVGGCRSKSQEAVKVGSIQRDSASVLPVEVTKLDHDGLARLIKERNGKTLLVNFWATWCAPCVEEFPDLVKLHDSFEGQPVEIVGVSCDFDDEIESKIVPFLRKQQVPFKVYVASFQHQEDLINAVDRSWSGALPATLIVDAKGERRHFSVGKSTFDQFKSEIVKTMGGL